MGLTVGEALAIKPLVGARVLAGAGGLDRVIEYVTVVDAPNAADWLRGGEFVLTTAYTVKDTPEAQVALVQRLISAGAAGLGIKLRRFIDALSGEALDCAEKAGFPIVEMPFDVGWADIITPVLGEVLDRQADVLQRSMDMHTQFIETVLGGGGMRDIAQILAGQTGAAVAVVDSRWAAVACVGSEDCLAVDIELLSSVAARRERQAQVEEGPWRLAPDMTRVVIGPSAQESRVTAHSLILASIGSDGFSYGRLLVREPEGRPLIHMDSIAIGHAVTTATLEALRLKTAQDVERRYRVNFWDDLVHRRFESPADAVKKAKTFDVDLTRPNFVFTVAADPGPGQHGNGGAAALPDPEFVKLQDDITQAVARLGADQLRGHSIVAFPYRRGVSVIVPWMGDADDVAAARADAVALAETIHSYLQSELAPRTVSIGVGRYYRDPMAVAMGYRESSQAVTLGTLVFGPNKVKHFDTMGAYRVMSRCNDHGELRSFVQDQLGAVVAYDEARGTELIPTLEAFMNEGCNAQATADKLFVHVNTLKYRLGRVERLAGVDLTDAETRFNLGLALRVRRYLRAVSQ